MLPQLFLPLLFHSAASFLYDKDVCIVGGGASGAYAALKLDDLGYSVALLEKEDRLGGHCYLTKECIVGEQKQNIFGTVTTRISPGTQLYAFNTEPAATLFKRFNIQTVGLGSRDKSFAADFTFGTVLPPSVEDESTPDERDEQTSVVQQNLTQYRTLVEEPFGFVNQPGHELPDHLIPELTMKFVDWLDLKGLSSLKPFFVALLAGINFNEVITYNVLKNFNAPSINMTMGLSGGGVGGGCDVLYRRIEKHLRTSPNVDIYLGANIEYVERSSFWGTSVTFAKPNKKKYHLRCRSLVYTPPPIPEMTTYMDWSPEERNLFQKLEWEDYTFATLRGTNWKDFGARSGFTHFNLQRVASGGIPYGPIYQNLFTVFNDLYNDEKVFVVYGVGGKESDEVELKRLVKTAQKVSKGYTEFKNLTTPATISSEAFDFERHVWNVGFNAEDVKRGEYKNLNRLQCSSNTAFVTHLRNNMHSHLHSSLPC